MPDAFPLSWPAGWPRTNRGKREYSRFAQTPDKARRALLNEIRRLVGHRYRRDDVILSTDIKLRQDGEPYAGLRPPEDPGIAVYFSYRDKPMVFACDRWIDLHDNIYSVAKTIEALRGIERWGASDMLERAFTGFAALEHNPSSQLHWWEVLGVDREAEKEKIIRAYRKLATTAHPDRGGSSEQWNELRNAYEQGLAQ